MSNESNPKKRRAAAGAMAVFTSASMLVGGIFNPPGALPDEQELLPPPVVLDEDDLDGDGKGGKNPPPKVEPEPEPEAIEPAEAEPALPEEEKKGVRRWWASLSFRQRLLLIPLAALAGWGVFALASVLLPGVLGKIAAWLMTLGALVGAFLGTEKAIFPHLPIKKLFTSRNLSGLALGLVGLGTADLLLPFVWSGYGKWEAVGHALGIVLVFGTASWSFASKTHRDEEAAAAAALAAEEAEEEEPEEEEPKPMTKEDILALADTVSRKRK